MIKKYSKYLSNEHLEYIYRNVNEKLFKEDKNFLVTRLLGIYLSGFMT